MFKIYTTPLDQTGPLAGIGRGVRIFGFGVRCGLLVFCFCFLASGFCLFGKITSGISDLVSDVVFSFCNLESEFLQFGMRRDILSHIRGLIWESKQ